MTVISRPLCSLVARLALGSAVAALPFLPATPARAQTARSGLVGTVVDEDGAPVRDLEISLVPVGETAAREQVLETNRRGRFGSRFLSSGRYLMDVKDTASFFIVEARLEIHDSGGLLVMDSDLTGHPEEPLGPIPIQSAHVTTLDLVVTDGAERERLRRAMSAPEAAAGVGEELEALLNLFNQGQVEQVLERGLQLLETDEELPDAHHVIGRAYARLERFDEAERHLRRAAELAPEEPEFQASLGIMLLEKARAAGRRGEDASSLFADAEGWLAGALDEMSPAPLQLLINHSIALEGAGREREALAVMERVLGEDPENIAVRLRMAALLRTLGERERALEILNALPGESHPDAADTYYNVAVSFYDDKDYESALAALERAEEVAPDHALTQRLLSRVHYSMGEPQKAIPHLRRFLELAPDHPEAEQERDLLHHLEQGAAE